MKAIAKIGTGENDTRLIDYDEPKILHNDEVLIKNEWVGICGTDIGILKGTVEHMTPVILGHELAGVIIKIGKNVTDLSVGDRVTAETSVVTCGVCPNCQAGHYNVCRERLGMGRTSHGAFRERMSLNHKLVHILPEGVSLLESALCEPAAFAYHAVVQRAEIKPLENVYIFGPGPIGILVAQFAMIMGADVTVLGLPADNEKLKLCESLGCHTIILTPDQELVTVVEVDVVFECSGSTSAANAGLKILRPRGRYIQAGLFKKNLQFDMNIVTSKELSLMGAYSAVNSDFRNVIKLIKRGKVNLSCLISGTYSLEEWETAFAHAADSSSLKVLIHP